MVGVQAQQLVLCRPGIEKNEIALEAAGDPETIEDHQGRIGHGTAEGAGDRHIGVNKRFHT